MDRAQATLFVWVARACPHQQPETFRVKCATFVTTLEACLTLMRLRWVTDRFNDSVPWPRRASARSLTLCGLALRTSSLARRTFLRRAVRSFRESRWAGRGSIPRLPPTVIRPHSGVQVPVRRLPKCKSTTHVPVVVSCEQLVQTGDGEWWLCFMQLCFVCER
jgi:hypothetical protein